MVGDDDVIEAAVVGVPDTLKGEAMAVFLVLARRRRPAGGHRLGWPTVSRAVLGPALVPKTMDGRRGTAEDAQAARYYVAWFAPSTSA